MRTYLVCTVGTRLFQGNLERFDESMQGKPENWEAMVRVYKEGQWTALAKELLQLNPTERV